MLEFPSTRIFQLWVMFVHQTVGTITQLKDGLLMIQKFELQLKALTDAARCYMIKL